MNRKAFMYTFVLGVLGLVIIMLRLWNNTQAVVGKEQLVMGQSSIEALQGLHDREVALQYFDVASKHASYDAVMDLFRNGGWYEAPCGKFGTTTLWYDRGVECFPSQENISQDLSSFMEYDHFTRQLAKNPYILGDKRPRDFVYYSAVEPNLTIIEGHTARPVLLTVKCRTQREYVPINILATGLSKATEFVFDWNPARVEQQVYACGQIALRPDFRHPINVSVYDILSTADTVRKGLEEIRKCDGDIEPVSCLKSLGLGMVSQVVAVDGGAVATYEVRIGNALPGINERPVLRFAIRVRKSQ
jgi:hypothetical protein